MFGPDEYPEAEEGDFIPGIFNYCDRWCERCPMTLKCRQYAMEATMDALDGELGVPADDDNADFWKRIDENLEKTLGLLDGKRNPAEFDIGLPDLEFDTELDEKMKRQERIEQENRKHPLALETMEYLDRVDPWFEKVGELLKGKGVDLESRVRTAAPTEADPLTESQELKEAAEVILWYHMQIHIKLQRALGSQRHEQEEDWEFMNDPEWQSDADGSAKVALIGIDRSLSAWGAMRGRLESQDEVIFEVMLQLDRIRRHVERQFPRAREFKRTGFDE